MTSDSIDPELGHLAELGQIAIRVEAELSNSIAHSEELGPKHDLSQIEEKRNQLLEEIESLATTAMRLKPRLDPTVGRELVDLMQNAVAQATPSATDIKRVLENQRESRFEEMKNVAKRNYLEQALKTSEVIRNAKALIAFEVASRLSESGLTSETAIRELASKAEGQYRRTLELIERAEDSIRSSSAEKVATQASKAFGELQKDAKRRATRWLWAGVVSLAALGLAIVWIWATAWTDMNLETLSAGAGILLTGKALLLVSPALLLLRVSIKNYSSSHHLRILYEHRDRILEQYSAFEQAIAEDDQAAKNQLRIEVVRAAFSDPETGLLDQQRPDWNLASVVQLSEGFRHPGSGR